jgi:hypothetical protein
LAQRPPACVHHTDMQSIKRTLSPINVDGFLNDEQTQQVCPRNKIYAPGQLVSGVARVKQDDMASVGKIWIELVGEQVCLLLSSLLCSSSSLQ